MAILVALLAAVTAAPMTARAATASLSGVVFYDRNDNGIRDPAEPGVPGIRIRHGGGHGATTTSATGVYRLTGLPGTGKVLVETGWLRSQCPATGTASSLTCAAGPGRVNDFAVDNQFIGYPLAGRGSTTGIDVGLLPNWPGTALTPPLVGGRVPANRVDVAARLSWTGGTCVAGSTNICRRGDTFALAAQVYNQGTTALSGLRTVLSVPAGDCLDGLSLVGAATAPAITAVTASPAQFSCATRTVAVSLRGTLAAGAAARIAVTGRTVSGPGTPGCTIGAVDAALAASSSDNLQAHLAVAGGQARPGGTLMVRAWASNTGVNQAPPGTSVVLHLPAGSRVTAVPVRHFLLACETAPGPQVVCRYRGPLSPHLAAVAIDVTVRLPSSGPGWRPVLCVTRGAGPGRETVPAAACDGGTVAQRTVTDNDATLLVPLS